MVDTRKVIAANAKRWEAMKVTASLVPFIDHTVAKLIAADAKEHYVNVSKQTEVPWFIVAVIHEREASQSWKGNLSQGDPWNKVSIHVPKGRGPFGSWDEAAVDALTDCAPFAARWKDWSAAGALTILEEYNGLGYAAHDRPSPYIWSSTNQYVKGKYVADGHYDPNAVDHQIGCAALLSRMSAVDDSIRF